MYNMCIYLYVCIYIHIIRYIYIMTMVTRWIPFGDHPLNMERCREYEYGPCSRMTRTHREV